MATTYESDPPTGSCWNCDHMTEVKMHKLWHWFCVRERDNGSYGEIYEVGPEVSECAHWVKARELD